MPVHRLWPTIMIRSIASHSGTHIIADEAKSALLKNTKQTWRMTSYWKLLKTLLLAL